MDLLIHLTSEKLSTVVDGNKYRKSKLDNVQIVGKFVVSLNEMFPSNLNDPMGAEAQRVSFSLHI